MSFIKKLNDISNEIIILENQFVKLQKTMSNLQIEIVKKQAQKELLESLIEESRGISNSCSDCENSLDND